MADNETTEDIAAEKRRIAKEVRDHASNGDYWDRKEANETAEDLEEEADRLDAAHKREIDVLKQRCAELDVEVAAKDEVIKRLNDAISEEQRRKMATTEKSSAVGDCAKLREALKLYDRIFQDRTLICDCDIVCGARTLARAALAAPPRNCDAMDWRTAWKIWREKFHPETPDGYSAVVKGTEAFMDWFTAPATEKEGETDGNE